MSLFDDVMINAKSTVTKVSKKAEQLMENTKLKRTESDINNEIEEKLTDLGLFVYESTTRGDMNKAELKTKIATLNELYKESEITRAMIAECKNKRACGICGSFNDKEAVFCNKCGTKLTDFTSEFKKVKDEELEQTKKAEDEEKEVKEQIKIDVKEELKESLVEELKEIKTAKTEIDNEISSISTKDEEIEEVVEDITDVTEEEREIFSNSRNEE